MIVDEDATHTYHVPASGRAGVIAVPKAGGEPLLLRAPRGQKLARTVPPRRPPKAATGGSWAETLRARADGAPNASDYAEVPPSIWGDPPVLKPWSPPAPVSLRDGAYAPAPSEPDWSKSTTKPTTTKRTAPAADGFAPCPSSPWD